LLAPTGPLGAWSAAVDQAAQRRRAVVGALTLGYIGVYLCRKNLSVAVPLLQQTFGASKAEVGRVASVGTLAYAIGKLALGPVIDRVGGRIGFLAALLGVAVLGAAGALAPSLGVLTVVYALNRLAGAGGWPSMMKLVPTWFPRERTATVVAALSLSYVLGGAAATLLGREIVAHGGGWRAVMGWPSLVLVVIALGCSAVVRSGPLETTGGRAAPPSALWGLLSQPRFVLVCVLSFTLTLLREAFGTWSVDFLVASRTGAAAVASAALQSTAFDLAGAASILAMGVLYDRLPPQQRGRAIAALLAVLAVVVTALPSVQAKSPTGAVWLVGAVGLLVYGPYSLLAGALAVESGGEALAASASGAIDAIGYLAGVVSGEVLGRVLDYGGYRLGFSCLGAVAGVSALLALGLRGRPSPEPPPVV
jgi:sugar phosphate permease